MMERLLEGDKEAFLKVELSPLAPACSGRRSGLENLDCDECLETDEEQDAN